MAKFNQKLLSEIDNVQLSPRLARFHEKFFEGRPGIASERVTLAMESWKETEGEPIPLRAAKKLKKIVEGIPITIHPGEILVGSPTKYFRGADPYCDFDGSYLQALMAEDRITLGGPEVEGAFTKEDWDKLLVAVRYFKGKTWTEQARATYRPIYGTWYDDAIEAGAVFRHDIWAMFIDRPDFDKVFAIGLEGIIKEVEGYIEGFGRNGDSDVDKLHFWKAAVISCQAAIDLAKRYAQRARELAAAEPDVARRAELEEVAQVCEWVPGKPPRNFYEACQVVVFIHLTLWLQNGIAPPAGLGLLDQLLYPYFIKDINEGRLTLEKAADILGSLLTYIARQERVHAIDWRQYHQMGPYLNTAIAGVTRDGKDASSEFTYFFLHMAGLVKYAEPHIPVRWHSGIPREIMRKAIETNIKVGGGVPQFQNSEHMIRYMTARGVSIENARDWSGGGCSQACPADSGTEMSPQYFNAVLAVDLALHNGVASVTGKRIGPETGEATTSQTFEQLYEAWERQYEYVARKTLACDRIIDAVQARYWSQPLASSLLPGCLEKGKDFAAGGLPHYRMWPLKDRGFISAADSLMSIKKLVFEKRELTMTELIQATDANFAGERGEEIRQMCLAEPKFGNDNPEVDGLVHDMGKFSASVIFSEKNIFGYPYALNRNGQAWHFQVGVKMGALPSGRKAHEPLADGSLSPEQGMDRKGPTAVLKSALRADFTDATGGILNMGFPVALFKAPEIREKMIDFIETFFKQGGTYIQFNILDRQTLIEAKKHPEQYKDLVVRVGGFSAYFVTLSPEVQDELIRRTESTF
ncbi:MAG: pyruvate formate lyase family protein [Chloroflexota bacterium]|nr:pyruvate formate lyase family protein [Chloroflexota bacterium]